ncbi:MAG: hypothetical protein FJW85_03055 [Actinobacteria bacterium]|nr:hypothetical protein [Actinomycetota bacterium]
MRWDWLLAAAQPSSAPVTQWPLRIALVLVVVAVIALVLLGMRAGWRRRARLQADLPAPALPPSTSLASVVGPVPGVFLGSTAHGDWLDRIVVHDLGVRSRATAEVGAQGIALRRQGARDVFIPAEALHDAQTGRGIAGKAYERDGVLVLTWELGGRLVDTGFRADVGDEQGELHEAILGLAAEHGRAGEGLR